MVIFVIVKITEHSTRLGGVKQKILEFKDEFKSLLVDLKNEIQMNIKSNITEQVNESVIGIKESIIDTLKEENKLLKRKVLKLEHKFSQSEAHTNNLEIQGIPSNVSDDAWKDKVINIFHLLNKNVNKNDIEDCHRLRKAVPKNTIVRFVNRKFCCEVFNLRKANSTKFGF